MISAIVGIVTSACSEKSLEVIEINEIDKSQHVLNHIIDSRVQILNCYYDNNRIHIKYKDILIKIDSSVLPFISLDEQGYCLINGRRIYDEKYEYLQVEPIFPSISISQDGFLIIDDITTNFRWRNTSLNSILSYNNCFVALAKINSQICVYNIDNLNVILPVIDKPDHIVPDYFFDHLVLKEKQAQELVENITPENKLSYIFFTDAHWENNQQHSPALIKHIVDYTNINTVIYGGDANTNRTETIEETLNIGFQFKDAFSFLGANLLCLFGNHDDNSTGQELLSNRHLSEEQVYSYLQSQMTNVNYWDYYNFFYDDPVSKTRFICLDTGRLYVFPEKILKTATFVIECLSSVPDDWHIVVASHIWLNLKNFDSNESYESSYVKPIIEILENYNIRSNSTFRYGNVEIPYDFSDAGAIVEYCIGGHTHADAVVFSQLGIPLVTVTCDGQQEVAAGAPFETGTINEQCVTIVVNNYKTDEVSIYHIGRGNDVKFKMYSSRKY